MAHIHLREIGFITIDRGRLNLIFHVPIGAPVPGIVPTPTSSIQADLDDGEIAALAGGTVAEIQADIVISRDQTAAAIAWSIKNIWRSHRTAYNNEYNFKYKHCGATIDDATA